MEHNDVEVCRFSGLDYYVTPSHWMCEDIANNDDCRDEYRKIVKALMLAGY